ncbi:four helix bundle protein [Clostridium thermarum]|uniref:four helix bundle protein n=1 Tax=Clostridium thermarum TaxID=1716543 RepID=UPI0013CFE400|nr:four helix bundle protein [Clostridium thermarum]
MKNNLIYDKAFKFSINIVNLYKALSNEKHEYVLSKQVLSSGTSIAANIKEAIYAQSKRDFLSKLNIALKEASEAEYWLELLLATKYITNQLFIDLHKQLSEIIKILASIVKTTKESLVNKY